MFFDLNSKINPQKPFSQKEIVQSCIEGKLYSFQLLILFKMVTVALPLLLNMQVLQDLKMYNFNLLTISYPQANNIKKVDVLTILDKNTSLLAKPEWKKNYENFKQYSRITLTVNDTRHITQVSVRRSIGKYSKFLQDSNAIVQSYDIVAVKTTNQKIFYSLCLENDVSS